MTSRTIAIGDVRGCSAALAALLDAIRPGPEDTLIPLGDYIDRGPDSRGVLDLLITVDNGVDVRAALADAFVFEPVGANTAETVETIEQGLERVSGGSKRDTGRGAVDAALASLAAKRALAARRAAAGFRA